MKFRWASVLLMVLLLLAAGAHCVSAQAPTPEATRTPHPTFTPTSTFTPWPTPEGWGYGGGTATPIPTWTPTPRPTDGFWLKVCQLGMCQYVALGNSMGGTLWDESFSLQPGQAMSVISVEVVSVPSWLLYAEFKWQVWAHRTSSPMPWMSVLDIPATSFWGTGYKHDCDVSGDFGFQGLEHGVRENTCWFRAATVDWCMHPEWRVPLHLNSANSSFGGVSVSTAYGLTYDFELTLVSAGPTACWTPQPTPTLGWLATPGILPTIVIGMPTIIVNVTMPPFPQFPPQPGISLTQLPYPTPLPSPTPNPTPAFTIGGPGVEACTSVLPDFGVHVGLFDKRVDFDFPGFRLCTVEYNASLNIFGIDFGVFLAAALAIAMGAMVYRLVRE